MVLPEAPNRLLPVLIAMAIIVALLLIFGVPLHPKWMCDAAIA